MDVFFFLFFFSASNLVIHMMQSHSGSINRISPKHCILELQEED